MPLSREQMAQRAAREVKEGFIVNLGIGIPTLVANFISDGKNVMLHSENGLLGLGAFPYKGDMDPDLINAGKQTVTAVDGASYFSSADSFGMIRGGHVDLTVLGAMQVDVQGSLANWTIPGKVVKGMGGAMDLVAGAQRVLITMQHTDRKGNPKLLTHCQLPLTGTNCVDLVITDLGVFSIQNKSFVLEEISPDITPEYVKEKTQAPLEISKSLKKL